MKNGVRRLCWVWAGMLGIACALAVGTSTAQPTDADKDRAGALLDRGDVLVAKGALEEALKAYREADDIMGVPTTRLPVAQVLAKTGKLAEALEAALDVTRMPATPSEPYAFGLARSEARKLAADLDARVPSVAVKVTGIPADVVPVVELDNVALAPGQLSGPLRIDPGKYRVAASASGFSQRVVMVTLSEGAREDVELALEPLPASSGAADSQLLFERESGGTVPSLAYVGFGVGAAGLVVGGVTGWMTISKAKDLEDACGGKTCPARYQGDIDSAGTMGWASNISFGVAAVGVVVGVTALLTGEDSGGADSARGQVPAPSLAPVFGLGQAGVAGRF